MTPYYPEKDGITIYHGDCREILPQLNQRFDLVLTDPPYGTTSNSWDVVVDFDLMWRLFYAVAKDNAPFVIFGSQPYSSLLVASNVEAFRHEWIWIKNAGSNFANTVREPMKEHESLSVFCRGKWTYNKQMQERTGGGAARVKTPVKFQTQSENYSQFERVDTKVMPELRVPSSWQKFNRERGLHPTQKPLALMEYMIRTYSNPGDVVLDPFVGSGTTLLAAKRLGRSAVGIELEERFCERASERISQNVFQFAEAI